MAKLSPDNLPKRVNTSFTPNKQPMSRVDKLFEMQTTITELNDIVDRLNTSRRRTVKINTQLKEANKSLRKIIKYSSILILALIIGMVISVRYTMVLTDRLLNIDAQHATYNDMMQSQIDALKESLETAERRLSARDERVDNLNQSNNELLAQLMELEAEYYSDFTYFADIPLTEDQQMYAYKICKDYNFEYPVFLSVMNSESSFRPDVLSYDGRSYGLCQIRDVNHGWLQDELGPLDFLNVEDNILAGVHMLADLRDKYNDGYHKMLMRYNCGEGGANKLFADGQYQSDYSIKIMNNAKNLYGYKG